MARLKTMTTQFIDDEPNGVRICRCASSTMTAVFMSRSLLSRAKQIADLPLRGVYEEMAFVMGALVQQLDGGAF